MKRTIINKRRPSDFAIAFALISRNLLFILFLGGVALFYIYNTQRAEKKVRNIQLMDVEIKELKWNYMMLKSDVMYNTTYSQVGKSVKITNPDLKSYLPRRIIAN